MTHQEATDTDTKIFFNDSYIASRCDADTFRKSGWIARSLAGKPIKGTRLVSPEPLTCTQLATVHSPEYIEAVRTGAPRDLAQSNGLTWDPGVWTSVCASNGGVVSAVREALRTRRNAGSLSSGLHHARRSFGEGFCTFNGLALGACAALDAGATRVLIIDLDAHCGGGTTSLVEGPEVVHVDVSVSAFDAYAPRGPHQTLE